jgi:hypothetical protein
MKHLLRLYKPLFVALLALAPALLAAQDDEDLLANVQAEKPKVVGTFSAPYVVNSPSNETVGHKEFQINFAHRFGAIAGPTSTGYESMWGLYQVRDIRLALDYGITDRLSIGTASNLIATRYDGSIKFKLLQQRKGGMPLSVTLFANAAIATQRNTTVLSNPTAPPSVLPDEVQLYPNLASRVSYLYQIILARKFGKRFSLSVVPTYLHRNYYTVTADNNGIFAVAVGTRFSLNRTFALTADYYQNFSSLRQDRIGGFQYYPPIGAGFEIIAGGHVFQILLTNTAVLPNEFLVNSPSDWGRGQMAMGFNLIRSIGAGRKKPPPPQE